MKNETVDERKAPEQHTHTKAGKRLLLLSAFKKPGKEAKEIGCFGCVFCFCTNQTLTGK
jgi:hypothetical protein